MSVIRGGGSGGADRGRETRFSASVFPRAWSLLRREGPIGFVRSIVRGYIFDYRRFFLYEYDLWSEACRRLPPLPDEFEAVFVADNETADRLAQERDEFRGLNPGGRRALQSGAVALVIYKGSDVAHVGWIATSQWARRVFETLPYEVRFEHREAWAGAVFTVPRFRGRGLLTYSALCRFAYLRDAGFHTCRSAVETNNGASNRVQMRLNPTVFAVGSSVKVLSWSKWTEHPPSVAGLR